MSDMRARRIDPDPFLETVEIPTPRFELRKRKKGRQLMLMYRAEKANLV